MRQKMGFKVQCWLVLLMVCTHMQSSTTFGSVEKYDWDEDIGNLDASDASADEWNMVEKKGIQFIVNGLPFYINGFNTYWLMVFSVDPSTKSKVTQLLQDAASVGLTVGRTWAFNNGGWRALQKSPGVYDEDVFKALDFVISEAKKYKIRLILSLSNNWEAYGGKAQYVKWGKSAGLDLTSDDAFFSDTTLKTYFKNYIKTVLTRVNTITNVAYKDDPTIFAWELMNEPRCVSDPSGNILQSWIEEMAAYVKSIDAKHLLESGVEGFYGPSTPDRVQLNPNTYAQQVGTDFIRNHQVPGIDFASVHIYTDSWVTNNYITPAHLPFVKSWTKAHIEDSEKILNMPLMFGEFGISERDGGYNVTFRDTFMQAVYDSILTSVRGGGGGAGSLVWQLFPEAVEYMSDGYAIVLSKTPSTAKVISDQSYRLSAFNTMCKWNCRWGCKRGITTTPWGTLVMESPSSLDTTQAL